MYTIIWRLQLSFLNFTIRLIRTDRSKVHTVRRNNIICPRWTVSSSYYYCITSRSTCNVYSTVCLVDDIEWETKKCAPPAKDMNADGRCSSFITRTNTVVRVIIRRARGRHRRYAINVAIVHNTPFLSVAVCTNGHRLGYYSRLTRFKCIGTL